MAQKASTAYSIGKRIISSVPKILPLIVLFVLIFIISVSQVNFRNHEDYVDTLTSELANTSLSHLLNANPIENLPNVDIATTDEAILRARERCKAPYTLLDKKRFSDRNQVTEADHIMYSGQCKSVCGVEKEAIVVDEKLQPELYVNGERLQPGVWCGPSNTNCNLRTSYLALGINNSLVCRPRYPRLFGGPSGSTVVACNDVSHAVGMGQLWDYRFNEAVNPSTIEMNSEDEMLADGSFRFRCKFGKDEHGNQVLPHPLDRFHPIRDICNQTIYRAHASVQLEYSNPADMTTWYCNCGDFNVTRVRNQEPSNKQTPCSACQHIKTDFATYSVPQKCFNVNSPITAINSMLPCLGTEFTSSESSCTSIPVRIQYIADNNLDTGGTVFSTQHAPTTVLTDVETETHVKLPTNWSTPTST